MQRQKNNIYIYKNKEQSSGFKPSDYLADESTVSNHYFNFLGDSFLVDDGFKSNKQDLINEHLKSILEVDKDLPAYEIIEKSGEKYNKGKLPMSKLFVQFPDALQAVVLASCYGHHRYPTDVDWLNFKKVLGGSQSYKDACLRHSLGAEKDEESGLPEIFHQAWNKLAELQLWLEENNINIKKFSKEYLDNLK